ncbi:MAG: hypothetical protein AABW48_04210 [Nanoarchaeota archaeon]
MAIWFRKKEELEGDIDLMQQEIAECISLMKKGKIKEADTKLYMIHVQLDHLKKLIKKINP